MKTAPVNSFPVGEDGLEYGFIRAWLASSLFPGHPQPEIPSRLNWEHLYGLLVHHRLAEHFYVLGKSQRDAWPPAFRERLRVRRYQLMTYGDHCAAHVRNLLSALAGTGMKVIVLKGWSYIPSIYNDDYSQRFCEDIDILIRPADVDTVEATLRQLNCQLVPESWPGYARRYWNGNRYLFPVRPDSPGGSFSVGLHWGLFHYPAYDPRLVDMDELFQRARSLKVVGIPSLELSAEEQLVYACAHIRQHRFDGLLFRYYEIAAFILKNLNGLDWSRVINLAAAWRQVISVGNVLKAVEFLWPEVIPAQARHLLLAQKPSRTEKNTHLWLEKTNGRASYDHLLLWLSFPAPWQRPLIFLQDVFPGPEYMIWRYGSPPWGIWPLLYLRRIARSLTFLYGDVRPE